MSEDSFMTRIEYEGIRVLTTAQMAESYGVTQDRIHDNLRKNADRYTHGKHYYVLEGQLLEDFRDLNPENFRLQMTRKLYLWTERGAARHAKSLNTEQSWKVFERLEEAYFNPRDLGDLLTLTQRRFKATQLECEALKHDVKAEFLRSRAAEYRRNELPDGIPLVAWVAEHAPAMSPPRRANLCGQIAAALRAADKPTGHARRHGDRVTTALPADISQCFRLLFPRCPRWQN